MIAIYSDGFRRGQTGLDGGLTDGEGKLRNVGNVEVQHAKQRLWHQQVRVFSHEDPEIESAV